MYHSSEILLANRIRLTVKFFFSLLFMCLIFSYAHSSDISTFSLDDLTVRTERLKIRPLEIGDIEKWYEVGSSNPFWTPEDTLEDIQGRFESEYIPKFEQLWGRLPFGRFAIILKDTEEYLGQIHFSLCLDEYGLIEMQYSIKKEYRRKGYCTEAVEETLTHLGNYVGSEFNTIKGFNNDALVEWGDTQQFNGIWARVAPDNTPSLNIVKKFMQEGTCRSKKNDMLFFYVVDENCLHINPMEEYALD